MKDREAVVALVISAIGAAVVGMWWHDTPPASVHGVSGWCIAAGDVTALLGTYLVLVAVVLLGRVPWLDRAIGMDRLAVWHKRIGQYCISLLCAHAVLTTAGYALSEHVGLWRETRTIVLSYPDVLAATVGLALLVAVGVTSARAARRRLSYQAWYFIHLYTYLAIALSFAHQLATGNDFVTQPGNRQFWVALYLIAFGLLVTYRVIVPLRDAWRHDLRVAGVVRETPNAVSVYITGRDLAGLRAEAGQFFLWRFLTGDRWWQAHPYSLSAAPRPDWLRVTVKEEGDHNRSLAALKPGTRVLAEGPYGRFTGRQRTQPGALLIAGGIGITPVRALFESTPGDVALIYRASSSDDLVLYSELEEIARARRARLHVVIGSRQEASLSAAELRRLVPDLAHRDVYLCGPSPMMDAVQAALIEAGVPRRRIHAEDFAY
jgi:predicted ferric reductase